MHIFTKGAASLGHALSEVLWPTRCIACELPGELLCLDCRAALELERIDPKTACPICGAPYGGLVCTQCTPAHDLEAEHADATSFSFSASRSAVSFDGVGKMLITAYKDAGEQRLDLVLAALVLKALRADPLPVGQEPKLIPDAVCHETKDWTQWCDAIVSIPARKDAIRKRGFDHMKGIARLVARWSGLPLIDALHHVRPVLDQRLLSDVERMDNLAGSMSADARKVPSHVIVLDDVFTTGATLSAAASALLEAGADEVRAATIAIVW